LRGVKWLKYNLSRHPDRKPSEIPANYFTSRNADLEAGIFVFYMAKGDWWFKFDFRVWRTDSALRRCSLETRAFWLEVICVMHETGDHKVTGSYEELGWLIGCSEAIVAKCCVELARANAADVTLGNGCVTLMSRRLKRELSTKERNRLRVAKSRCNADVMPVLHDRVRVISNKKEIREEKDTERVCVPDDFQPFLDSALDAIRADLNLNILRKESEWVDACQYAYENKFSVDQFVETFRLLRKQKWRKGRITAQNVADNLTELPKLRIEIEEQENGTDQKYASHTEKNHQRGNNAKAMVAQLREQGLAERAAKARQGLLGNGNGTNTP
jgi:hypothetical protein